MPIEKAIVAGQRGNSVYGAGVATNAFLRALKGVFDKIAGFLPMSVKYGAGTVRRRNSYPYCLLRSDDFVIQIGASRESLVAGRSRAVYFGRIVTEGTVLVIEPDPANCAALKTFLQHRRLMAHMRLVEAGAWNAEGQLEILSGGDGAAPPDQVRAPVHRLGSLLGANGINGTPRLVSIAVPGSERQILEGMREFLAARDVPYISLSGAGSGCIVLMREYGYEILAQDDRGYTFRRRDV